jgi:ribose/xylose/arabinose/galactoside ABC-type transport system permease subunit
MGIAMGLSRIVSNNSPVSVHDDFIARSFGGNIFGLPKEIVWMIVLVILGHFLLHKTQFGKNLHLVGDNREASRLYGVSINKSVIWAFVLSALFAAFAGMLEVARSAFASPGAGEPYLLTAIVASVIGGTSLQGGKGSIIGAFFGGLFLTIISNALFRLGIAPWVANVITGVVILVILTGGGMVNRLKRTVI